MRQNRLTLAKGPLRTVGLVAVAAAVVASAALFATQSAKTDAAAPAIQTQPSGYRPDSTPEMASAPSDSGAAAAPAPAAAETLVISDQVAPMVQPGMNKPAVAMGQDDPSGRTEGYGNEKDAEKPMAPPADPAVMAAPTTPAAAALGSSALAQGVVMAGEARAVDVLPIEAPAKPSAPKPTSGLYNTTFESKDAPARFDDITGHARGPAAAGDLRNQRALNLDGDSVDGNLVKEQEVTLALGKRGELERASAETASKSTTAHAEFAKQLADQGATRRMPVVQQPDSQLAENQNGEEPAELEDAEEALDETERKEKPKADKNFRWQAARDGDTAGLDDGRFAQDDGGFLLPVEHDVRPAVLLPRTFYFENTYLGGDAGYAESLRRLDAALSTSGAPHRLAQLPSQGFDAPVHDGLGLVATLDRASLEEPGRVYLQVGLRGSDRYGWRRPPLEVVALVDQTVPLGHAGVAFAESLLDKLGPQDRIAFVTTSGGVVAELDGLRRHRAELAPRLDQTLGGSGGDLGTGLVSAATVLVDASQHRTTAPGTQVVILLTADPAGAASRASMVSELGLQGIVTSVIGVGSAEAVAPCFALAAAGHGNLHAATDDQSVGTAIDNELELLARVVARLVRINVRLAPGVSVVRVLGSRPLGLDEVKVVKAREVETDRRLSNVLGIAADRGDDDDGIQTVIPVFYGGDAHVVVLELWAEHAGAVADVSVKYKDLVNLDNKASQTSVALRPGARQSTADQLALLQNVRALQGAEALTTAASALDRGDLEGARQALDIAPRATASRYGALIDQASQGSLGTAVIADSLRLAARRFAGGGG